MSKYVYLTSTSESTEVYATLHAACLAYKLPYIYLATSSSHRGYPKHFKDVRIDKKLVCR